MAGQIIRILLALSFAITVLAEEPGIPPAEEIMARVAETYRAPQRYYMSGTVTATLRQYPDGIQPTPVIIAMVDIPKSVFGKATIPEFGIAAAACLRQPISFSAP